jgi:hypothetical protein
MLAANAKVSGFAYTSSSKDFSGLGRESSAKKKGRWRGGLNLFKPLHLQVSSEKLEVHKQMDTTKFYH